jgi:hypothetical protein
VAADANRRLAFGSGWWPVEPFGRWAGAETADLRLRLDPSQADPVLVLSGIAYGADSAEVQVFSGPDLLIEGPLGQGKDLAIPLAGLSRSQPVDLQLHFAPGALLCPLARAESNDARRLVIMLQTITLRDGGSKP